MNRRKHSKSKKVISSLDLPRDLFLGAPIFTMYGNGELLIENHRGILTCEQDYMIINAKHFPISIRGKGLRVDHYTADSILICGRIEQVLLTV